MFGTLQNANSCLNRVFLVISTKTKHVLQFNRISKRFFSRFVQRLSSNEQRSSWFSINFRLSENLKAENVVTNVCVDSSNKM